MGHASTTRVSWFPHRSGVAVRVGVSSRIASSGQEWLGGDRIDGPIAVC